MILTFRAARSRSEGEVAAMHDHDPGRAARPGPGQRQQPLPQSDHGAQHEKSHSMWWMLVCCAPMVLIALALALGLLSR
jgi:hypothetical protein